MIDFENIEELPGIYIFKNLINQKYYVGESLNVKRRIKEHLRHTAQPIGKSIKKHGKNNFNLYIEYFPLENKETLLDIEEEIIKQLNCSTPIGYNICKRGQDSTGRTYSEEARANMSKGQLGNKNACGPKTKEHIEKIAIKLRGQKRTNEVREKISKGHMGIGIGRTLSDETKLKISNSLKGKKYKKIITDQEILEICKKYSRVNYSAPKLAKEYGVSTSTIYNCLKVYSN
jgi:group I intron endonuclease